jgi:hypothetical protein
MIRLAIYYSPDPRSPLAMAASDWLGRDIRGEKVQPRQAVAGLSQTRLVEILGAPFHYAFHGTIKPPFRLKPGVTIDDVVQRLQSFAAERKPFPLPPLQLTFAQNFFCLCPTEHCSQLHALASVTMRDFDEFRQAPSPEELIKRRKVGLTPQQEKMLLTWGYPYAMEEFRFHLTLTGRVGDEREIEILHRELEERFPAKILDDLTFAGLSLFLEMDERPMRIIDFFPFNRS